MRLNLSHWLRGFGFAVLTLALIAAASRAATPERPAARQSPEWLRDAVVYEVFPRAFSEKGDFKGVTAQLDRLKELGVTIVWLMPIHPVGREKSKGTLGSPYAVRDYDAVNPEYGNDQDLTQLVAAAHKRGLKVFIDLVANHTAWDAKILKEHPEWYTKDTAGKIIPPNPDWVDVADLDWSQPALREYMTGSTVRWLREFGIDGFRADYASGVPTDYWESVREQWDKVRPGMAFLAESDDPQLLVKAFDFDYAWDFYQAMSETLAGRAPASHVRETWQRAADGYPRGALRLRFSDNHDQLRATGAAGLPAALAASAVMFTLDGVPLLYNGMEVGDTSESAAPALFEHIPIRWDMAERRPHVNAYYRALTQLRRAHPALTRGEVRWLRNGDEARVLSYERAHADETLVVVVNLSSQPYAGLVDAGAGDWRDITPAWSIQAGVGGNARRASTLPALILAPWETRVFRRAAP